MSTDYVEQTTALIGRVEAAELACAQGHFFSSIAAKQLGWERR